MNLDDLLKVNSVRCIKTKVHEDLVEGEIYNVEGFNDETIKIVDRNGYSSWHNKNLFEPIPNNDVSKSNSEIDTSLNSVDDINTTFKVGDKAYLPNIAEGEVLTLLDNKDCHYPFFVNVINRVDNSLYVLDSNGKTKHGNFTDVVLKATQENYEMLCKLYPHIEFGQPPKEITRSDLTKEMFKRGTFAVVCKCSDTSEIRAIAMSPLRLIVGYSDGYFEENNGTFWKFAVPYDPKTNLPLTEDVLNDIN